MSLNRRAIQNQIAPAVETALSALPSLDMSDAAHQRRMLRALVHVGARELLLRGVSVKDITEQTLQALAHEVKEYQESIAAASGVHAMILPQTAHA